VNAPLYVGLILSDAAAQELATLADHVARLKPRIGLWLVFHEKEEFVQQRWVTLAREILEPAAPGTDFAAGTLDFFTELNRNRPPADSPSLPCFSQNPQVHAFDLATMVENLYGAASSLDALRTFSTKAAVISPVTLTIRSKHRIDREGELPPDVDPRQMSLFAAGWTVGSVAQLAAAGNVRSLTYFETIGWRGLMEREAGSLAADIFPSKPESVFPLYHVFADIAQFAAGQIQRTCSSHPLLVTGLTLVDEKGGRRILVANLSAATQQLKIDCGDCCAAIRYLDETNVERAMNDCEVFRREPGAPARSSAGKLSVRLLPFAVARVDIDPEAC
jgi:hypothetical protein